METTPKGSLGTANSGLLRFGNIDKNMMVASGRLNGFNTGSNFFSMVANQNAGMSQSIEKR